MSIPTRLTTLFNITSPIVSAPMAYATTPALVAAVINAGGLGFLGAGNDSASKLAAAIDEARAAVVEDKRHLVSMGLVGWVLDMFDKESDPRLNTVLDKRPAAVWLAYGSNLGKYVERVRAHNATSGHAVRIFVTVNTVEEAERAANEWKVDVICVQGAEAGGRGSAVSPPTTEFLKSVLSSLPSAPPVIAAGGIGSGAQIASALSLGASGVVLGTRFLLTPECSLSDDIKQVLIEAGPDSTVRSPAYDFLFPPGAWPKNIEARCVKNGVLKDWEEGVAPTERKAKLSGGGKDTLIVYAGVGVSELDKVESTAIVMKNLHAETLEALK